MKLAILSIVALLALTATPVHSQIVAYDSTGAVTNTNGDNGGNLNIGPEFTVNNVITISSFGVYDAGGDGLADSHNVTLFNITTGTAVAVQNLLVPAGTGTTLTDGFRFEALPTPLTLVAGDSYGLIVYGLSIAGDEYADHGGLSPDATDLSPIDFTFNFTSDGTPVYPDENKSPSFTTASFIYTVGAPATTPEPSTYSLLVMSLGALAFMAHRRSLKV